MRQFLYFKNPKSLLLLERSINWLSKAFNKIYVINFLVIAIIFHKFKNNKNKKIYIKSLNTTSKKTKNYENKT